MKKILFLSFLACLCCISALSAKTPPTAVLNAFHIKFPNVAHVSWDLEKNGNWEAEFEIAEIETSANFSADGKWIETESEIKPADLPAPVRSALTGKKIKEAARILRADGTTVYEAEVGKKDLVFDEKGKQLQ